ncbi:head-tail connector protein [Sphingopyxis kveilinensis]|uniref:head-tail connector protein n=1 Tax=Sphingopyxis kveilinensis TaxID=3114367 RepID=UPI0030CBCAED
MAESISPGDAPVSLNEARGWLRLGATVDDAVVAGLVRAATNICEAFIGQWLIVRAAEERLPIGAGTLRLNARPVVGIDGVALIAPDGGEMPLGDGEYRVTVSRDGSTRITVERAGDAERLRVAYRAGVADGANGIPEAIRQGIVRMTQHLHDARDGAGAAPPAAIAALWQPWRRLTLGSGQ